MNTPSDAMSSGEERVTFDALHGGAPAVSGTTDVNLDMILDVPVTLGIAGERYLEVLSGLSEGDRVITGPFESVRGLYEGDPVNTGPGTAATTTGGGN